MFEIKIILMIEDVKGNLFNIFICHGESACSTMFRHSTIFGKF